MAPQAAPAAPTNPAIDQIPGQTRQAPPVQAAPKLKANPLAGLLPPKNDEPYSPLEELQKNVSGALNVAKQVPSNLYNLATSPAEYFKNIDAKNLGPAIIGGFNPSHIGKLGVPSVKTAKAPLTEPAVSTITEPVVSPAVEAARAKQAAARANAQAQFGEPTPTDRQTFPVTPENEGIAAIQKGKLELERQAEAARKTAAPAETTPITPIEAPAVGEKPIHPFDAANATKSRVPSTLPYAEDQNPYVANTTANKYDSGVMGGAPLPSAEDDIVAALRNKPEEVAAAPEEKTGGMDMNRLMLQMGLHLMAGKSPNALTNVGEAGLGTLAMQQAEAKALSDIEAKKSEAEYRKKMGEYYGAYGEAIGRGSKEKNLQLEAEKLIAQEISKDKFINMPGQEAARAAREAQMRSTIYRQLGIEPTMAAGAPAPAGGFSVVGSRPG